MEFFRNTNIDFLGKKWYFLTFSLIFSVAGIISMGHRWATTGSPVPLGVDFRGGTLVYVKYSHTPDPAAIHDEIDHAGLKNARVQRYGQASNNEVLIALDIQETSEQDLSKGKDQIKQALESHATPGKQDLNNSSSLDHPELSSGEGSTPPGLGFGCQSALHRHRSGHCRLSR